jgi:5-methylcytosine-specific restriction endonuclease McrA
MSGRLGNSTLVLNASYEALTIISVQRALILLLSDKAEYVEADEATALRGPSTAFPMPVVIRLLKYVKIPHSKTVGLSRRSIIARDQRRCVYCGKSDVPLTIDHIVPRSRGGEWSWTNLVASCFSDNNKKGNRTAEEMGWEIVPKPKAPVGTAWRIVGQRRPDPRWLPYL